MPSLAGPTLQLVRNPTTVTLGWNIPTHTVGTDVQRTVGTGPFVAMASLGRNVSTWTDAALPPAPTVPVTVTYRVRVRTHQSVSLWSNTVGTIILPSQVPKACTVQIAGDLTSVTNAVNAAAPGDTICVNAGSWTWTSSVTQALLINNKRLTLKGAGIDNTIITHSGDGQLIRWNTITGGLSRLTGFTIIGSATNTVSLGIVEIYGVSPTMRIDHNKFVMTSNKGFALIKIFNYVRGVADNNIFDSSALDFCCGYYVHHDTWSTPGSNFGDVSWAAADSWGTDQAWYWESNTLLFDNTGKAAGKRHTDTSDGWMGGRVVNRFNTYANSILSAGHGTNSGQRWRGRRQTESYHETLTYSCATCGGTDNISPAIGGRSATMMVWGNTLTDGNGMTVQTAIGASIDRFDKTDTSYQPWAYCGANTITSLSTAGVMVCAATHGIGVASYGGSPTKVRVTGATGADAAIYNGIHDVASVDSSTQATLTLTGGTPGAPAAGAPIMTSAWDGNVTATGHPCLDQIGYGQSDLLSGTSPSPVGWPNQVATPSMYWMNTLNGATQTVTADGVSIVLNREYYDDTTIPHGTIGARPGTCTTGTFYFATDQGNWNTTVSPNTSGKLYKCISTNTWAAWYGSNNATGEPLTYPHPTTFL